MSALPLSSLTPINLWCKGTGLKLESNWKRPLSGLTLRNWATSTGLGRVADKPTSLILSWLLSMFLRVLATILSITGPLSSFKRWISSKIISLRVAVIPSDFLVMTSHFSGVVTMTWVSRISCLLSYISPVSSLTVSFNGFSLSWNFSTISAARAFMGET